MKKIQEFKPIERNGLLIFDFTRSQLEVLVEESKKIDKIHSARKLRKTYFYIHDLEVIQTLQRRNNFLLYDLDELKLDEGYIKFIGRSFDENQALNGRQIEFIVRDLEHRTSKRFAYAIHETITRNFNVYSKQFESKGLYYSRKESAENYFNHGLIEYLKGRNLVNSN